MFSEEIFSSSRSAIGRSTCRRVNHEKICHETEGFLKSEDGPTAVEYAVMLSLIIVVCITAVSSIGTNASSAFTNVAGQLGGFS